MTAYTNTLQVVRVSGLGVDINNENVGTGTTTVSSYDLDNGNVITDSASLKYAASGSNDFTTIDSGDYTLDLDGGSILLNGTAVTNLGSNVLYADYTHSPKLSDTVLTSYLNSATEEVDKITGNYWGEVKTTTETQDGREDNPYPSTDEPYVNDYDDKDFIQLSNLSVQSVDSIGFFEGTAVTGTVATSNFRWNEDGFITLLSDRLPLGKLNVKVDYTHGYSVTPEMIQELTALLTGIRGYVNISGGSYDDATSYTLGRKAITIGEAWVNIREVISQANKRIKEITDQHGPKMDVV